VHGEPRHLDEVAHRRLAGHVGLPVGLVLKLIAVLKASPSSTRRLAGRVETAGIAWKRISA